MKKSIYRSRSVKSVVAEKVVPAGCVKVHVAIDVAKEKQYSALVDAEGGEVLATVHWLHPSETREFFGLCGVLKSRGVALEAVMEPTGTYGDAIREGLVQRGIPVFQVSGKRVHDASEIRDGVPSLHDAKAAQVIAWLHRQGASRPWPSRTERERDLSAASEMVTWRAEAEQLATNRMEAKLARHWPELTGLLSLNSATLRELLATYGSPAAVARSAAEAAALMRRVGRSFLSEETVRAVVESARTTLGMPMTPLEQDGLRLLAREAQRGSRERDEAEKRLLELSGDSVPEEAAKLVGAGTAAVLLAEGVDPTKCTSAAALVKTLGLNLREYTSGKKKGDGRQHISKRGSSRGRQMLYMAVLRLLRTDPWMRAWYAEKLARDGGAAPKAIVALERKLTLALWHVWTKGEPFDSKRLFDTARLQRRRDLQAGQQG